MTKNETKQLLLEVGIKAILEKSYHSVGLQEILNRAGVPKGSFYYYFNSKEDYLIAIIEYYGKRYGERYFPVLFDEKKSFRERIIAFFINIRESYDDNTCNNTCRQGCLLLKLTTELSGLSPRIREALQKSIAGWIIPVAQCLREGVKAGEFILAESPEETAAILHSIWTGTIMSMQVSQSLQPADLFLDYLTKVILQRKVFTDGID